MGWFSKLTAFNKPRDKLWWTIRNPTEWEPVTAEFANALIERESMIQRLSVGSGLIAGSPPKRSWYQTYYSQFPNEPPYLLHEMEQEHRVDGQTIMTGRERWKLHGEWYENRIL